MRLSTDDTIFWHYGVITINLTLVTTWALMLVMVIGSAIITRKLKTDITISHWQGVLEMIVHKIAKRGQIGRVDAILVKPNGDLEGGADPRGDDCWMGF